MLDAIRWTLFLAKREARFLGVSIVEREMLIKSHRRASSVLGIISVLLVFGMLVAGLQPFHSPRNGVTWLPNANGLRFHRYGTVVSAGTFEQCDSPATACSVEIWLQASEMHGSGTLMSFHSASNPQAFSLRQDEDDLSLVVERRAGSEETVTARSSVENVFHRRTRVFVTISSSLDRTEVYVDGVLAKTLPFTITTADLTGRLVVATSPVKNDDWSCDLHGLAFYGRELTGAEVLQHYREWQSTNRPDSAGKERAVALYLFDEHSGNVVRDHGSSKVDLYIPEKYTILHEKFLQPAWKEINLSWSFWKSAFINVAGFIPLGFFFCAYLSLRKPFKRAAPATMLVGLLVSLTIEVLQAYLPTRDSGTGDLITNTLGTAFGIMLYQWKPFLVNQSLKLIPFVS
jgi:VanZ family protein